MKIGWMGLGRLGLPCALQLAAWGHDVVGYDVNPDLIAGLGDGKLPDGYVEPGVAELLALSRESAARTFTPTTILARLADHADIVFVAVQTPHAPDYDGTRPVRDETRDFEYGYLVQAVRELNRAAPDARRNMTVVIVSTVMPGTTERLIRPLTHLRIVYSPQFIAMGTVLRDFTEPEFVLIGGDDASAMAETADVFRPAGVHPYITTIRNAELIKVAYNTWISMKIVWANHLATIADAVGADSDAVVNALALGHRRIMSDAYMRPGMGDGGACHPRDLIALADLERRHDTPTDLYAYLATARDDQTRALAQLVIRWCEQTQLKACLLGMAYKPGVPLRDGSPARLLEWFLRHEGGKEFLVDAWDPGPTRQQPELRHPKVFVVSTNLPQLHEGIEWPRGSVIIDPWGQVKVPADAGVILVRPGRRL